MTITYQPVAAQAFEALFALRMDAIASSLQQLGIYNAERSRQRFAARFVPACMQHICRDGQRVGFYTLYPPTPDQQEYRLEHLYIHNASQGQGIGTAVLRHVQGLAQQQGVPLTLYALRLSAANRFYQRHGFVITSEDEIEHFYRWLPEKAVA